MREKTAAQAGHTAIAMFLSSFAIFATLDLSSVEKRRIATFFEHTGQFTGDDVPSSVVEILFMVLIAIIVPPLSVLCTYSILDCFSSLVKRKKKGDTMSKKLIALILLFLLSFSACSGADTKEVTIPSAQDNTQVYTEPENAEEIRGVWISYIEIRGNCASEAEFSERMNEMFTSFSRVGITDVFFHVRPFGDAVYPSELFPTSSTVCEKQGDELSFDPLTTVLAISSRYGMRLHAWINPYRASADSDLEKLSDSNMAKIWYLEGNGDVNLIGDRYYFNPASDKARELITEGAAELLRKYPELAGIHIDDYFYPENCGDFDRSSYEKYLEKGGDMSRDDWRRENVNILVRELYGKVKSFG